MDLLERTGRGYGDKCAVIVVADALPSSAAHTGRRYFQRLCSLAEASVQRRVGRMLGRPRAVDREILGVVVVRRGEQAFVSRDSSIGNTRM